MGSSDLLLEAGFDDSGLFGSTGAEVAGAGFDGGAGRVS